MDVEDFGTMWDVKAAFICTLGDKRGFTKSGTPF